MGRETSWDKTYIAIDLKSFYASVECRDRGLDPLQTNLVVADASRTEKTICLAVSPSLKAYGISGRARLFETVQRVREVNAARLRRAPGHVFRGSSYDAAELQADPSLELAYIVAPPRMAMYMKWSTKVYQVYLQFVSAEDIHVYSIDEVFIDATAYLKTYGISAHDLTRRIIREVLDQTGITATAGIGSNLYLAKIAMDIVAKHAAADQDGVRIAMLDEMSYRRKLWNHRPITDFWRVGPGYARRLAESGMFTMGDVARCSVRNEALLYQLFGVNAELLIDHAWGWEPCSIDLIKQYRPAHSSFSYGQVLQSPYTFEKARLVTHEMADAAALDLVGKGMVTDQVVLTVGYDVESLTRPEIRCGYHGEIKKDRYGRQVPKHAHGTANLPQPTSSGRLLSEAVLGIFDRCVDPQLLIRRITINTNHVVYEAEAAPAPSPEGEQLDMFTDYDALQREQEAAAQELQKEHQMQEAMLAIKQKYGKNSILKGMNLQEGATGRDRNRQIGGHKA